MAPNISVPANFGKHHLNSRSHNNLELLCAEGETYRANSMIMSLNCRVIDDLITRLDITSLDMQDFSMPAVRSFVESMYSGELEDFNKNKFRELNKMGKVFEVNWFVERCKEYYKNLVEDLNVCSYQDIEYVVEEARYAQEKLKEDEFTTLIVKKLDTRKSKKSIFLKKFAKNLDNISISQLQMVVTIAGKDVGILVSILFDYLQTSGNTTLGTDISQNLFKNTDFFEAFTNNRYYTITNDLFVELLLDGTANNSDFTCAVEWIYKSLNKHKAAKNPTDLGKSVMTKCPVSVEMSPKEFLKLDWDSLLEYLSQCSEVNSLTSLFDAVFTWLWGEAESGDNTTYPRISLPDCEDFIKDIVDIAQDRRWTKVSQTYLQTITVRQNSPLGEKTLVDMFLTSDKLSLTDNTQCFVFSSSEELTFLNLFSRNLKISLVTENNLPSCEKDSKCAVLLELSSQPFGLVLANEIPESDTGDIHYHSTVAEHKEASFLLTNVHWGKFYPLPFNTPPSYVNEHNWHWGYFLACDENRSELLPVTPPSLTWYGDKTKIGDKIRITVFLNFGTVCDNKPNVS